MDSAAYFAVGLYIGGWVLKQEGGRYFVGNHGNYQEVTRAVYDYSRIHRFTLVALLILTFAGLILQEYVKFKSRRGRAKHVVSGGK
jgi:hypothetical protein